MIDPASLVSFEGFLEAFWREFRSGRTQRESFDRLNDLYERSFGVPRFSSYDAFRKRRDRRDKIK